MVQTSVTVCSDCSAAFQAVRSTTAGWKPALPTDIAVKARNRRRYNQRTDMDNGSHRGTVGTVSDPPTGRVFSAGGRSAANMPRRCRILSPSTTTRRAGRRPSSRRRRSSAGSATRVRIRWRCRSYGDGLGSLSFALNLVDSAALTARRRGLGGREEGGEGRVDGGALIRIATGEGVNLEAVALA